MRKASLFFSLLAFTSFFRGHAHEMKILSKTPSEITLVYTIHFDADDALFVDSLSISSDHPGIKHSWKIDKPTEEIFDSSVQMNRATYNENVPITIIAQKTDLERITNAHIHFYYQLKKSIDQHHDIVDVIFNEITEPPLLTSKTREPSTTHKAAPKLALKSYHKRTTQHFYNPVPVLIIILALCWMLFFISKRSFLYAKRGHFKTLGYILGIALVMYLLLDTFKHLLFYGL